MSFDVVITRGTVHGECPECGQPFMGSFDADDGDDDGNADLTLNCVGCNFEETFTWKWPDDLPAFYLTEKSND